MSRARLPALGLALAGLLACDSGGPNLLLVSLDAVRADRLGAYGAEDARTPVLDGLAREGAVFERAFASTPLTLPSHTTLLTGLDPLAHGVHDDARFRAAAELPFVAVELLRRGYATAAFVGAWSLERGFGLARGFARYDDEIPPPPDPLGFHDARRSAREVTDRAVAWLAARPRAPFFVWVHYADVQAPRRPAPPFEADPDRYRAALSSVDAELGRLLEAVRRRAGGRETLVVAVADHGESLGEGGEWGHGILTHERVLRVPLIVAGPGFPAASRWPGFARTEDVAPTLLRAAGVEPAARSLQDLLAPGAADPPEPVWFGSRAGAVRLGWAPLEGVRTARWKLTLRPGPPTLHDLRADPHEAHDVAAAHPDVVERLSRAWREQTGAAAPPARETPDERRERVARAGHLPAPPHQPSHRDPRRVVQALAWVERAAAAAAAGRVEDGIRSLRLLGESPVARPLVLARLGSILLQAERPEQAAALYRELFERTGGGYARVSLAAAWLAADRPRRAVAELDGLEAERGVLSPRARVMRGFAQLALGRPRAARLDAERALAQAPGHEAALALKSGARSALGGEAGEIRRLEARLADAGGSGDTGPTRLALAELLVRAGRDADAAEILDAAPEPDPELLVARAAIAARRGNAAGAVERYERALALRPLSRHFHRELAALYAEQGRFAEAGRLYGELLAGRPDDAALHTARATALLRAGRRGEAEAGYRRALALDAGRAAAWYHLASIELDDGREAAAEAHLKRVLALRPDFSGAHLQLARLYHRRGDPRSAHHAERAVRASAGPDSGPTTH